MGSGAYGIVASAEDSQTGGRVAVKKVGHAYADLIDAKRVVREIKLLRALGAHENVVALEDLSDDGEDVYIMTRLAGKPGARLLCKRCPLARGRLRSNAINSRAPVARH